MSSSISELVKNLAPLKTIFASEKSRNGAMAHGYFSISDKYLSIQAPMILAVSSRKILLLKDHNFALFFTKKSFSCSDHPHSGHTQNHNGLFHAEISIVLSPPINPTTL